MHTLPILLALLGCLRPEEGIDRTRVIGTIRVDPVTLEETGNALNGDPAGPLAIEPLAFGYRILTGSITAFVTNDDGQPTPDTDTDCWSLVTPVAREAVDIDVTLADLAASARVSVYNRDVLEGVGEAAKPSLVTSLDVVGWNLLTVPLEAKVNYSLCIAGLEGTGEVGYDLVVSGQHPDEARLLVGVYKNDDAKDRGALLGGTNALAFRSVDRWSFVAPYEMLFFREFETDTDGDVVVLDENIKEGFIYAGTWANLAQALPAGTWYSSEPVPVDLTKTSEPEQWGTFEDTGAEDTAEQTDYWEPPGQPTYPTVKVEEPVVVDKVAPVVLGDIQAAEVEPNDAFDLDLAFTDVPAQDLGVLTGPGFVDAVSGAIRFDGNANSWDNDIDAFKFQVPEPLDLAFTLDWPGDADLDIMIMDAEGVILDYGWYGHPEINTYGTGILEPGLDYYIAIAIYNAPDAPGTEVPWDLKLEQNAP